MENQSNDLSAKIRIHFFTTDKCFGPGIYELLENVRQYGSLRSAATSMNMAYSKAWKMVKLCEENLGFKLLISTTGGKNGGGAQVTEEAQQFMLAYDEYCCEVIKFSDNLLKEKFSFYKNNN